jgi:hypothetical protein
MQYVSVAVEMSADKIFEHIRPHLIGSMPPIEIQVGDKVYLPNINSTRLRCITRSPVCVSCGIVGTIARLEAFQNDLKNNPKSYHFNIYGRNDNGSLVLLTQDHIFPKSLGGPTNLGNLQTMCATCNRDKGDVIDFSRLHLMNEEERIQIRKNLYDSNAVMKTLLWLTLSSGVRLHNSRKLGKIMFSKLPQTESIKILSDITAVQQQLLSPKFFGITSFFQKLNIFF